MKWLPTVTLCLTFILGTGARAQVSPAAPLTGQKVVKDPAEYNAYMKALNLTDPATKSTAFEAFISAYPTSILVSDALRQAMAAYQAANDVVRVEATARKLLVLEPDDLRSLAIMTAISRNRATQGDPKTLAVMRDYAERGLRQLQISQKPEGFSGAEYAALRVQISAIFYGARGIALLNEKQFTAARDAYVKALETGPTDLADNYQLGIAEMQIEPMDVSGFWYLARASNLANAQHNAAAAKGVAAFAQAKYKSYHGSDAGWETLLAGAGVSGSIPANFAASISRAPTAAEIAVKAVHDYDPATLSFSDWEFVLTYRDSSPANAAAAAKVWAAIQAKEKDGTVILALPVTVVSSTPTAIEASITDENIESHIADLHVVLAQPLGQSLTAGSRVTAMGVITSYQQHPFRFEMTKGRVEVASANATKP